MIPVSSCALSACEHGDVQDQDAGGVVPARTDRAALPAGRILPLVAGGEFVRVGGDAALVCVLLLGLGGGKKKGEYSSLTTTFISHTTRPPAPSKTLAQHPLALGRSSPWVWASAEPLRPSVRTTLRQEPARICTLRRSLRHTQQKMRSRRTEPAAQYQPRPAASAPPHPRSCLLMGKDLWLGGRRQRPPCVTRRPARSWR